MKTQQHNQGELKELKVMIEKQIVEDFELMSKNAQMKVEDLVTIALKRFKSSHSDYMGKRFEIE
jgi:hypothetical protein